MEKQTLKASKRTISGRKVKKLRREGILPVNLYGKKVESLSLQVIEKEFTPVFAKAGETGLVELIIDGKKLPVLINNIQYHPVSGNPLHADFYQVDLKEKVSAKVPFVIVGESPAVRDKLGVLLHILSEFEVEALPTDLPDKIEVDISKLAKVDDVVKVSSLSLPDKIKILTATNLDIVKIAPLISKEAKNLAAEEAAKAAVTAQAQVVEEVKTAETTVQTTPDVGGGKPEERQKVKTG